MAVQYGRFISWIWKQTSHLDFDKYWKRREYIVTHPKGGVKAYYYLWSIKRIDAYHNSSLGTHIGNPSAYFKEKPILPHGLNGIIISNDSTIGKNVQIYHQVTIAGWDGKSPVIGDNVLIGAGAKIIGNAHIGNGAKIGAGCVVTGYVPDNATVVMSKPRIIIDGVEEKYANTGSDQRSME